MRRPRNCACWRGGARTRWGCPRCRRGSPPGRWACGPWGSPRSPTWPPARSWSRSPTRRYSRSRANWNRASFGLSRGSFGGWPYEEKRESLGDEIQGMLKDLSAVPDAVTRVHEVFHPREITIGVGIGTLATPLAKRVTEMDGPAFVNSRIAVELAKKEGLEVVVRSGVGRVDDTLNAIYSLLGGIQVGWTDAQWDRFNLYRRLGTIR